VQIIKEWRSLHLKQQWDERAVADSREERARTERDRYTGNPLYAYLNADFVSNQAGDTPHFRHQGRNSKSDHTREKIMSRICGVHVICGDINTAFLYYVDDLVSGGGNLQAAIWRHAIADLQILLQKQGYELPRHMGFTFDNCGENKNYTVFGYFALLIELDFFEILDMNTLVVGHTHNFLDQILGAWATIVNAQNFVATPTAMEALLQQIHEGTEGFMRPSVIRKIDVIYDLQSHLERLRNKHLTYVFLPHVYRFSKHKITKRTALLYSIFSGQPYLPHEETLTLSGRDAFGVPIYHAPEANTIEVIFVVHINCYSCAYCSFFVLPL